MPNINKLPQLALAHLPTPVEALPRLTATLGGPQLWVKRDDQTGLAFGGNKTRKLAFLLADAQKHAAQTLITRGAAQSNHCRQTAAAAARTGFECTLVLTGNPPATATANLLLDQLCGAQIVWSADADPDETLAATFEALQSAGKKPYLIPYGGSNPTGAAAYVFAMQEFMNQDLHVDRIVIASSSGGTQAGMLVGSRLFGFEGEILGISVDPPASELKTRVAGLATQTAALLGVELSFNAADVQVNDSFLGGGYAVMGALEKEAIRLFAAQEGLLVDPVYTGRAAGGLLTLIRQGHIARDERILFWHTGGSPALFAYSEALSL